MKKTILAITCAVTALSGCSKNTTTMTFQDQLTFEYGENIQAKNLVKESNAKKITYPNIDVNKIGTQTLSFDGDGEKFTCTITIKDTKKPIITVLKNPIKIQKDSNFDISNFVKVEDEIDGEFTLSTQKDRNHYCVEGSVDCSKVGTYPITITALDKNNNESKVSVEVVVEGQKQTPAQGQKPTPHQEVDYPMNEQAIQAREQIFTRFNEERSKKGLQPFTLDTGYLQKAAMIRAKEVNSNHSSKRPDGRDCFSVVTDLQIPFIAVAENFAYTCTSAEDAISAWVNNIDYYRNITAEDFNTLAVGVCEDSYVVIFIGSE